MTKSEPKSILTKNAPSPRPVLSQAVAVGNIVFCSGQLGVCPVTKKMLEGDVTKRAEQCLKNLSAVLEAAGSSLKDVIKVNIYLTNLSDFAKFNETYAKFFDGARKPARTCIVVKQLPNNSDVEIECVAYIPEKAKL